MNETHKKHFCKDVVMTIEDEENFQKSKVCDICKKKIKENDRRGIKVRDRDHITGSFRGAAHHKCNSMLRVSTNITCIAHNGEKYDNNT